MKKYIILFAFGLLLLSACDRGTRACRDARSTLNCELCCESEGREIDNFDPETGRCHCD